MISRIVWTSLAAVAACGLLAIPAAHPARADQAAAEACLRTLTPQSHLIYDAAAPEVLKGAEIRATLQSQTRHLVETGQVPRASARSAAVAAAPCLRALKR